MLVKPNTLKVKRSFFETPRTSLLLMLELLHGNNGAVNAEASVLRHFLVREAFSTQG